MWSEKTVIDGIIMYTLICVILYVLNTFTVIFLYSSMWGLKNKHLNLTRYGHGQTRLQIVRSALYSIFNEAWYSALYSIFRPKYGCYFVFRTLNGGGRGGTDCIIMCRMLRPAVGYPITITYILLIKGPLVYVIFTSNIGLLVVCLKHLYA